MKRSEMITYLARELRRKDQCVTTNIEQCRYLVEKVLKSCETRGMLPPALEGPVKVEELENGDLSIKLWGWEEEDES